MTTHLMPIFNSVINQEEVKTVNAQLLHSFLEVDTRFNDWINRRINEYQFIENIDFILVTQKRVIKGRGGDRKSKDYHITLDMAKELSMVERTEKGREARKYFIGCEKRLMQILQPVTINPAQQQAIKQAVNERHYRTGESYQAIYAKLYTQFRIPRYQDLPAAKFDEAIQFLGGEVKRGILLDDRQLYYVYFLLNHFNRLHEIFNRYNLYTHLTALGSKAAIEMIGHFNDGSTVNIYLKDLKPDFEAVQKRLELNQHLNQISIF